MTNPLKKIWELVISKIPNEKAWETLEIKYNPKNKKLDTGIFYKYPIDYKNNGEIAEDFVFLEKPEIVNVGISLHTFNIYKGEAVYCVLCKNCFPFTIYEFDKFYYYATINNGEEEIYITPYLHQILVWAKEWKRTLSPDDKICSLSITTIMEQIKKDIK